LRRGSAEHVLECYGSLKYPQLEQKCSGASSCHLELHFYFNDHGKIPQTLHDLMESNKAPMAMPELCGIDNSECQRQAAVFLIKISSKLQIHYQIARKIPKQGKSFFFLA
jgi:hypothetical protein